MAAKMYLKTDTVDSVPLNWDHSCEKNMAWSTEVPLTYLQHTSKMLTPSSRHMIHKCSKSCSKIFPRQPRKMNHKKNDFEHFPQNPRIDEYPSFSKSHYFFPKTSLIAPSEPFYFYTKLLPDKNPLEYWFTDKHSCNFNDWRLLVARKQI